MSWRTSSQFHFTVRMDVIVLVWISWASHLLRGHIVFVQNSLHADWPRLLGRFSLLHLFFYSSEWTNRLLCTLLSDKFVTSRRASGNDRPVQKRKFIHKKLYSRFEQRSLFKSGKVRTVHITSCVRRSFPVPRRMLLAFASFPATEKFSQQTVWIAVERAGPQSAYACGEAAVSSIQPSARQIWYILSKQAFSRFLLASRRVSY